MRAALLHIAILICLSLLYGCKERNKDAHASHKSEQDIYTCPMHPEIIRNEPGSCPICGMDLVKKETGSKAVFDIELEALLKPTNNFVISAVPLTTLQHREEDMELDVVGAVAYDTRQIGSISSRVSGRIEKLNIRYKYQPVTKGQTVMEIYSPELSTAQQNLLFLLKNDASNTSLINAAKQRLLLSGMSDQQVEQVVRTRKAIFSVAVFSNYSGFVTDFSQSATSNENSMNAISNTTNQEIAIKEGMYVQSGQAVLSVYNPANAWVLLDIFPEQQPLIKVGNAVRITPETAPTKNFRSTIAYIEPVLRQGNKTVTARVYFNNSALRLPIGSRVTATIFRKTGRHFWLPKESLLSLGKEYVVFRKEAGGFRAHKVVTGISTEKYIQIADGLDKADSVAVNAQFLVDNEAFIKVKKQ